MSEEEEGGGVIIVDTEQAKAQLQSDLGKKAKNYNIKVKKPKGDA